MFFLTFLFGTTLSLQFALGAEIILVSVFLFSNDLPKCAERKKAKEKGEEMKPILPK